MQMIGNFVFSQTNSQSLLPQYFARSQVDLWIAALFSLLLWNLTNLH
jgi:tRNA(His) 5'-end guanylyltransferase